MKSLKFTSIFVIFCVQLFSVPGSDPNFTIAGRVNAITGEYHLALTDLVVQSAEPYPIKRIYSSKSGWKLIPQARLKEVRVVSKTTKKVKRKLFTNNADGRPLYLHFSDRGTYTLDLKKHCETNLPNVEGHYTPKYDVYALDFGDGTKRYYVKNPKQIRKGRKQTRYYRLYREDLPNGNTITYEYNTHLQIKRIEIRSRANALYSWINITRPHKQIHLETSDHKQITYHLKQGNIAKVSSPNRVKEFLTHIDNLMKRKKGKKTARPFETIHFEENKAKELYSYDLETPLYSFCYSEYQTTVTDCNGNTTLYKKTADQRPHEIVHPDKSFERFTFSKTGDLLKRQHFNPKGIPLKTITYQYDDHHNIVEKRLGEDLLATYRYNELNLPTLIKEPSGKITHIHYKKGTNLELARFICNGDEITSREFFTYDKHNRLIKKTFDNGTTDNPKDLQSVTERKITKYSLVTEGPALHMPASVTESYWDPITYKTIPLQKTIYTYDNRCQVINKEIINHQNNTQRTCDYSYDEHSNLVLETDNNQNTSSYSYNNLDQCTSKKQTPSKLETCYKYDLAGRIIERRDNEQTETTTYNLLGQILTSTDYNGLTTNYKYDKRGNLITKSTPFTSTHTNYDYLGNPIERVNEQGETTCYRYNQRGQITHIFHPDGARERFTYSPDGNLIAAYDPAGRLTVYTYDYQGQVLTKTRYSQNGEPLLIYDTLE